MWSLVLDKFESRLKLVVLSGSIVIGSVLLQLRQLIDQSTDDHGLCEIECFLSTSNSNANEKLSSILKKTDQELAAGGEGSKGGDQRLKESGMLRLTYSYEAHSDVYLDSDTDNSDNGDAQDGDSYHPGNSTLNGEHNTIITAAKTQRKERPLNCSVQSVNATRLKAVHTLTSNSPFLTVKCGNFRAVTKVLSIFLIALFICLLLYTDPVLVGFCGQLVGLELFLPSGSRGQTDDQCVFVS